MVLVYPGKEKKNGSVSLGGEKVVSIEVGSALPYGDAKEFRLCSNYNEDLGK